MPSPTLRLALYTLTADVAIFFVYVFMFADRSIWNPNFMHELLSAGFVTQGDSYEATSRGFEMLQNVALPVLALVMIIENAANFYRATRSHISKKERIAG